MICAHGMKNAKKMAADNGMKEKMVKSFERAGACLENGGVGNYVLMVCDKKGRMLVQKKGLTTDIVKMQITAFQGTLDDCVKPESKIMEMWQRAAYHILKVIGWEKGKENE